MLALLALKKSASLTHANASQLLPVLNEWIAQEFKHASEYIASLPTHAALKVPVEPFDALLREAVLQ